ncbi:putative cysteine desulfurase [candidate division SR1 bacterium RAAC1_SR1_1]|nr:putative cysteine desulfurase [candidate division SR1 bacterium RAAC1_SR1_1]
MMYKKDFPIFEHNPGLVFLDNGASCQKPKVVIDGVSDFVAHDYANIHRGLYELSERSEKAYYDSKTAVARLLGCKASEIFYTYNSTYAINIIAGALVRSKVLTKGDVVLLGIWEHHANVLPWQILAEEYGFEVKFFGIKEDYTLDRNDFSQKYDEKVKVVACSHVSNVTGQIYDVKKLKQQLRDDTFFLIDGSQSVPHFVVDVLDIGCDALVFTGHKMMAYTGIGGSYLKKERLKKLSPMIAGGGTIEDVSVTGHTLTSGTDKFEAGTPNIIGAVSLLKAIEYINNIGGMQKMWEHEQEIVKKVLKGFELLAGKVDLIGTFVSENRVGAFSFVLKNQLNFNKIGEIFAEHNIAVRCGGHCAYPLHKQLGLGGTCRMSTYIYNDEEDVEKFFEVLSKI